MVSRPRDRRDDLHIAAAGINIKRTSSHARTAVRRYHDTQLHCDRAQPPRAPSCCRCGCSTRYGLYATFWSCARLGAASALVLPGGRRRAVLPRADARAFSSLAGMPLTVRCPERLPAGQCVVVSNHASYLDGVVFTAALPPQFAFVIKREMNGVPLAGTAAAPPGLAFRGTVQSQQRRGRRTARAAQRHQRQFAGVLSRKARSRPPGAAEVSYRRVHHRDPCGMPASCRQPCGARGVALPPDRRPAAPGPHRSSRFSADRARGGRRPRTRRSSCATARGAAILRLTLGEPDLTCCGDTAPPPRTAHARSVPASRP